MNKETNNYASILPEAKREERTCSNCGSNKNCEEFRDRDPAYSKEPCEMWFQYPSQKPAPASPFAPFVPPFRYKNGAIWDKYELAICNFDNWQTDKCQDKDRIGDALAAAMNNPELTKEWQKVITCANRQA